MRMKTITTITAIGGLLFLTGVATAAPASGLEIARHVIGAGGAHLGTGTHGVEFAIGRGDGELGWDIFLPLVLRQG